MSFIDYLGFRKDLENVNVFPKIGSSTKIIKIPAGTTLHVAQHLGYHGTGFCSFKVLEQRTDLGIFDGDVLLELPTADVYYCSQNSSNLFVRTHVLASGFKKNRQCFGDSQERIELRSYFNHDGLKLSLKDSLGREQSITLSREEIQHLLGQDIKPPPEDSDDD